MNRSHYLLPSDARKVSSRSLFKAISAVIVALVFGGVFGGSILASKTSKDAEALDWTQWIMCSVAPDPAKDMYQISQTSDLQYQLRSKSTMNNSVADVDDGLNSVLSLTNPNYKKVNEPILGYSFDLENKDDKEKDKNNDSEKKTGKDAYNKGEQVSVYDRFGVAGMSFTSYQGEWKYILVDACNTDTEPKDPKAGLYYENRMEPRSTWEYISTSSDARTIQFNRGIFLHLWTAIVNVIANGLFWITKAIVVFTNTLIGFSFSNLVDTLGLSDLLAGDKGGVFSALFSGIYLPLIFFAFILTAGNIFWSGVVKRQYRNSLTVLLRSLVMFVLAFVIAAAPGFWLMLPNNIAILGQSIVLTTLNNNLPGTSGLCSTNVGSVGKSTKMVDKKASVGNWKQTLAQLDAASKNMRSATSCQFWQAFLLRPWSEGQFGTNWNNLWAHGKIPKWAGKNAADLDNLNGGTVGKAEVPLGDGKVLNNWALYQLSAQTNVHAPTGKPGEKSKYTSGVANDWWRIVDALSNYDEETKTMDVVVSSGLSGGGDTTVSGEYTFPIANPHKASDFGYRVHPVTGKRTLHAGIDYSAPTGTSLYAVADGTVSTNRSATGGNVLEIHAVDGWTYRYLHTSAYVAKNGQKVKSGDEVAKVGSTGRVTGPHLHFETRSSTNEKIDPNKRLKEMGFNPDNGKGSGEDQTVSSGGTTGETSTQPYDYGVPKNNPVTPYWDTWVGNNSFGRIWAAMSSILIASIGLAAPLVLSGMAAVYTIGTAVMMAFAPLFLLLGCWGGKGWEIFKGWGELLVNTTLKRIVVGLLLGLSISFTVTAIKMIDDIGWFQGVIVLVLLSLILLNSRKKIIDMLANIRFASVDFMGSASQIGNKARQQTIGRARTLSKNAALSGSKVAASVGAGAVASKASGGTLRAGAKAGFKNETKNFLYRGQTRNDFRITKEMFSQHQDGITEDLNIAEGKETCASCGKVLEYDRGIFQGGRTVDGNLICNDCFLDGPTNNSISNRGITEVHYKMPSNKIKRKERDENTKKEADKIFHRIMSGNTAYEGEQAAKKGRLNTSEQIVEELKNDRFNPYGDYRPDEDLDADARERKLIALAGTVNSDIQSHQERVARNEGNTYGVYPPKIPEFLSPYFEGMEDFLWVAWQDQNYDYIMSAYAAAVLAWFEEEIETGEDGSHRSANNLDFDKLLLKIRNG